MTPTETFRANVAGAKANLKDAIKLAIDHQQNEAARVLLDALDLVAKITVQDPPDQLNEREIEYVKANNPIMAIKNLRNRTNLGLKESKDIVDAYRRSIGVIE